MLWIDLKALNIESNCLNNIITAFESLRNREELSDDQGYALTVLTDKFVTCALSSERVESKFGMGIGEEAVTIAKEVNWHNHSKSCKKKLAGGQCRFDFPKYPLPQTEFIDANKTYKEGEKLGEERKKEILRKVRKVLLEEINGKIVLSQTVKKIMKDKKKRRNN